MRLVAAEVLKLVRRRGLMIWSLLLTVGGTYYTVIGHQRHWYASLALKREVTARPVLEWVLTATKPTDVVVTSARGTTAVRVVGFSEPVRSVAAAKLPLDAAAS